MRTLLLLTITIMVAGFGCDEQPMAPKPEDRIIVRAYLLEGQPVENIQLMHCYPIDEPPLAKFPAVSDAQITLSINNQKHRLELVNADSGYYAIGDNQIRIRGGDSLFLHIHWNSIEITAATKVPEHVQQNAAFPDTVYIDTQNPDQPAVTLYFQAEAATAELAVLDKNPQWLWYGHEYQFLPATSDPQGQTQIIYNAWFEYAGQHQMILMQFSNHQFLRYNQNSFGYTRDFLFTALETNIQGGLGYLTAAVVDTFTFYVAKLQ